MRRFNSKKDLKWEANPEDLGIFLTGYELMQPIAESARLMGTTLWFDPDKPGEPTMFRKIAATGQFTTCVNLL